MGDELTYSVREATAALGVSLPTFYELANREGFPVVRVGRRVLVPVDDLRAWLSKEAARGA